MTKKTLKFGNGFTDFFKEHFDFTKMSTLKKVLHITVIAVICWIIFYFVYSFIKFSTSAVKHLFDFGNYMIASVTQNAEACFGCNNIYDSNHKLETPEEACPPNGIPFVNKNCMGGIIFPLFIGLLPFLAYSYIKNKSKTQKAIESASGKSYISRIKDFIKRKLKLDKKSDENKEDKKDPKTTDARNTIVSAIDMVTSDPSLRENKDVLNVIREGVLNISKDFKVNVYTYINTRLNPLLKNQNINSIELTELKNISPDDISDTIPEHDAGFEPEPRPE